MRKVWIPIVLLIPPLALVVSSGATPQFARQYDLDCSSCHVHVPKLNTFGEEFLANGYTLPDREAKATPPLSVWSSVASQNYADRADGSRPFPTGLRSSLRAEASRQR